MTSTTTTKAQCDKRDCHEQAAWTYRISTLYGIEEWSACQGHVREVREMHGDNILSVRKAN